MSLYERIDADLKQAMRDRDEVTKLTLRSVKTALTEASKAGTDHALGEEQVMAALQKEAKRRRDAAAEYERVGQPDRAAQENAELAVLQRYLPQQLGEEEIEAIARVAIAETGATSPRDMGKVMPVVMQRTAGTADGKAVSQVVRRLLAG
jgi:uncharacterized protein YqeY